MEKKEKRQKVAERLSDENTLQFYQKILEGSREAIIVTTMDSEIIYANQAAADLVHLTKRELMEHEWKDFFPAVPEEILVYFKEELHEHGKLEDETVLHLKDGTMKFVQITIQRDENLQMVIYYLRDITYLKEKDRFAVTTSMMLRNIYRHASNAILLFDCQGNILDVNPAFCREMSVTMSEAKTRTVASFVPKEYQNQFEEIQEMIQLGRKTVGEIPMIHANGMTIFDYIVIPVKDLGINLAIMQGMNEHEQMEIRLKKSEKMFEELFNEAVDAIVFWNRDGSIIKANRSALKVFECTLEELLNRNLIDFIDNIDDYEKVIKQLNRDGQAREEMLFQMPNGQKKHLEFTVKMPSDGQYHLSIFRNVSDRYRMEKELRESEERFRKVFEESMDGMILWDEHYVIKDINHVACRLLKAEKETFLNQDVRDVMKSYASREEERNYFCQVKKHGQAKLLLTKKCGEETKYFELASKLYLNTHLNLTVIRDVTEQIKIQEQLRKSDTLNVVGELAAGIAHEIRNPLTAMKGFIQLLEHNLNGQYAMYFEVIKTELERIESIITEFLILAKPQAVQFQKVDIGKVIRHTVDLLTPQALMTNVQLIMEMDQNLPVVYAESNQLKQVFINIIKNAIEVMPKGGNVLIQSKVEKEYICIMISDEGTGIPEEKIKKLGEPFYTTKERGTGLGLMVSFKIIKEHNGKVEVKSSVGKGTTFYIYLPVKKE
ncbi:PAS domain S-box protein [Bacillus smithii]|uniref:PAS domain S-box protein n=1 Tax=Bacillus smithii TaxID=1479 RepID=UPI002E1D6BD3|nr:PAS domain S-box protein [Bacillus smithii]MED1455980.1 PAS domain S-box protein [Bacillus smithii]